MVVFAFNSYMAAAILFLPIMIQYSDHDSVSFFNDITVDFTMKQLSQLNTKKLNGFNGVNG